MVLKANNAATNHLKWKWIIPFYNSVLLVHCELRKARKQFLSVRWVRSSPLHIVDSTRLSHTLAQYQTRVVTNKANQKING